ncbi:type VII secretion target [Streptomyces cucumeris]|uniref:type VII secretion target n=1 Tax=Streptomyces cucumeris TaxID=2962890 RepID=UPI0020C8E60F|nr:type VII secretion target [Streptomyces sp. NEAU-Y11]MCP9210066.1 type VII secretion target [Streptomyces sp. NEAU-Y11]
MTFEEEWAQLKAAAQAPAAATGTRLDSAGGGSGPGGPQKLHVTASVLRGRAGRAETVRGQFLTADDEVMTETGQVSGSLTGFATDKAIDTFLERWKDQMAFVKGQFSGTASALRTAADAFTHEDTEQALGYRTDRGAHP